MTLCLALLWWPHIASHVEHSRTYIHKQQQSAIHITSKIGGLDDQHNTRSTLNSVYGSRMEVKINNFDVLFLE